MKGCFCCYVFLDSVKNKTAIQMSRSMTKQTKCGWRTQHPLASCTDISFFRTINRMMGLITWLTSDFINVVYRLCSTRQEVCLSKAEDIQYSYSYNSICAQRRLRSAWASVQSDQNLRRARSGKLKEQGFFMQTAKTQTGRMSRLI